MPWGLLGAAAIGAVSSAFGAANQNKAARAASQRQMDFQERMSNTQYQRSMADMKTAGLNPILAYQQGGAGTPGGSSYTPSNVGAAATTGAQAGASSALNAKRFKLEEKMNTATLKNLEEDTYQKLMSGNLSAQQRLRAKWETDLLQQDYEIKKTDVTSAKAADQLYKSPIGPAFRWWQMLKRR